MSSAQTSGDSISRTHPTLKLWTPRPRHRDFRRNNEAGRQFADQVLSDMQKTGNDSRLQAVLRDVILRGEFDATHVGFVHRIAELAKAGFLLIGQTAAAFYVALAYSQLVDSLTPAIDSLIVSRIV